MHAVTDAFAPEQHDAEEGCFEEECSKDLVPEQRTGDISDSFHETRPVGAELKRHGDTADHAQRKGQRKELHPEPVAAHPQVLV